MSLKAFHIFFIVISTALALGFGLWAIGRYRATDGMDFLAAGVMSLVGSLALVVYGRWFLRKLRGVSYL